MIALPMTTNGCRARLERRGGISTVSGSSAVRGLRGVMRLIGSLWRHRRRPCRSPPLRQAADKARQRRTRPWDLRRALAPRQLDARRREACRVAGTAALSRRRADAMPHPLCRAARPERRACGRGAAASPASAPSRGRPGSRPRGTHPTAVVPSAAAVLAARCRPRPRRWWAAAVAAARSRLARRRWRVLRRGALPVLSPAVGPPARGSGVCAAACRAAHAAAARSAARPLAAVGRWIGSVTAAYPVLFDGMISETLSPAARTACSRDSPASAQRNVTNTRTMCIAGECGANMAKG